MKIITLIFNNIEGTCAMFNGSNKLEMYTYQEGEIVLSAMEQLKIAGVISLEIVRK